MNSRGQLTRNIWVAIDRVDPTQRSLNEPPALHHT